MLHALSSFRRARSLAGGALLVMLLASAAPAAVIDLSLNVLYTNPSNPASGGTWELVAKSDVLGLKNAEKSYGPSWKLRGGVDTFHMLQRKWQRLENRVASRVAATGSRGPNRRPAPTGRGRCPTLPGAGSVQVGWSVTLSR